MKTYFAETDRGCGLRTADSIAEAREQFNRECGADNVRRVRIATDKDIAWVRGMGGYVPPMAEQSCRPRQKRAMGRKLALLFPRTTSNPRTAFDA